MKRVKATNKPTLSASQRAEEDAVRRQHEADPVRRRPAGTLSQQSFGAILALLARFKKLREHKGLTPTVVAERMGIDPAELSRMENGKSLNPTLAVIHQWAQALGEELEVNVTSHESA